MTLNQLYYFQAIARYQHFHRAAEALHIAQPSLSRSMSLLEEELGIRLFERKGRGVELSKYGMLFLDHVNHILEELEIAQNKMQQLAGTGGHIDIGYVYPLASHYIPHLVHQFLSQAGNENITFSFNQEIMRSLLEGLKSDRLDLIFGTFVENEPSIHFIPILNQKMAVIVPLEHPFADKKTISLKELELYPHIGYDHNSELGKFTRALFAKHRIRPDISIEAPDENAIAALVAENFGVSFVADIEFLHRCDIRMIPLEGEPIVHTVYMAYVRDRYKIPAVNKFIRYIKEMLENDPGQMHSG